MSKIIKYDSFIKRVVFLTVLLMSLVFILFTFFIQLESFEKNLEKENSIFADMVFENLYTTMKNGGNINDIESLVKQLENKANHSEIFIHKNINDTKQEHIRSVFTSKEATFFEQNNNLNFAKPIIYQNECIKCHIGSKAGDIAAVIQIETPFLEINVSLKDVLISILFLFISSSIIIFFIWYVYLKKTFITPLNNLVSQIKNINCHDDYEEINITTKIQELKEIGISYNNQLSLLKNSYKEIEKLTNIDKLTNIYNRKKFEEDITILINQAQRYDEIFTLILIDLNKFKPINDTYGHNIGDLVLKKFSKTIKSNTRETDLFYRIGGDEFILLLPKTNENDSLIVMKHLKDKIADIHILVDKDEIKISASFGIQEYIHDTSIVGILELADKKMYENKMKRD